MSKDWTDDKRPEYIVSKEEIAWAKVQHPRKPGIKRLCVQVSASAKCRVYPMFRLMEVLNAIKAKPEWEVFLLGEPGKVQAQDTENVKNLSATGTTFRQSAAIVAGSDVLLGSDSAFVHVAGALGVPAIGLYGPFPWKLRTAYSPSVTAVQGKGKCSPCFFHEKHFGALGRQSFPPQCPSKDKVEPGADPRGGTGYCEVLASIEPKRVIALIEKVARKAV
jgi:heptosyltransferase-2